MRSESFLTIGSRRLWRSAVQSLKDRSYATFMELAEVVTEEIGSGRIGGEKIERAMDRVAESPNSLLSDGYELFIKTRADGKGLCILAMERKRSGLGFLPE